jgi:probable phosphoglycerate mutase
MDGVHINQEGQVQVEQLVERLSRIAIDVICSSPLDRTRETAALIARSKGLEVRICPGLNEVEAGDWTGCKIDELDGMEKWKQYNMFRSGTRIPGPGGELMVEVQARMVVEIERLREQFPHGIIAVVSHGDPIKAAIAHYMGIPLDFLLRFEVDPASVSVIAINDYGAKVLCINQTGQLPRF